MNTATRQQSPQVDQRQQANAVTTIQPSRMPIPAAVAKEFDIAPAEWRVLVEQIFPAAKSIEAVMMALAYCRKRNLDIFKKPVHIVPMWSSAKKAMVETVWPGIAEIRTTASRTGEYAGIDEVEFGPMVDRTFEGMVEQWEDRQKVTNKVTKIVRFPEWAKVTVYRMNHGVPRAYTARIFWEEMYATTGKTDLPNDMWGKRPRGQLDKCVEAAALRKAFPEELGNIYAAEEMEGREISEGVTIDHAQKPKPPAPPAPPAEVIDIKAQSAPIVEHEPATTDAPADHFDVAAYFEELETSMAGANDEATIEEVWTSFDPGATFQNDDLNFEIAEKIKMRRLAQVNSLNGG